MGRLHSIQGASFLPGCSVSVFFILECAIWNTLLARRRAPFKQTGLSLLSSHGSNICGLAAVESWIDFGSGLAVVPGLGSSFRAIGVRTPVVSSGLLGFVRSVWLGSAAEMVDQVARGGTPSMSAAELQSQIDIGRSSCV